MKGMSRERKNSVHLPEPALAVTRQENTLPACSTAEALLGQEERFAP